MVLADFSVSAGETPLWQWLHSMGPLESFYKIQEELKSGEAKYLIHSLLELLNFG